MRRILLAIGVLPLLLLGSTSLYSVNAAEYVLLTQFGRPVLTLDGATDAGLHAKLPWPLQSVERLDHRLRVFDLGSAELLTQDSAGQTIDKTLTVSAFVCWRIDGADGVERFIRTVGSVDRAEAILGQRITSRLGAVIGNMRLEELISVVPTAAAQARMDRLSQRLLNDKDDGSVPPGEHDSLRDSAGRTYGIELVDVRLRRFNYPVQVREAIFDRIRSERSKKVADYQNEGMQLAEDIKSRAEYDARTILAAAKAKEQRLKGEAEARADRIRNQAQGKDPAFYAFLKKLEEYQRILGDNKTVLLLSSHRELFDLLFKPPPPESHPLPVPSSPPGPLTARQLPGTQRR